MEFAKVAAIESHNNHRLSSSDQPKFTQTHTLTHYRGKFIDFFLTNLSIPASVFDLTELERQSFQDG